MDNCLEGGFNVRKIDPMDELIIMEDFKNNVNIVINGESLTQNQLLEKLYYNNRNREVKHNNFNSIKPFKKEIEISEESKPIEPGQVDPVTFFGNSLKNFII